VSTKMKMRMEFEKVSTCQSTQRDGTCDEAAASNKHSTELAGREVALAQYDLSATQVLGLTCLKGKPTAFLEGEVSCWNENAYRKTLAKDEGYWRDNHHFKCHKITSSNVDNVRAGSFDDGWFTYVPTAVGKGDRKAFEARCTSVVPGGQAGGLCCEYMQNKCDYIKGWTRDDAGNMPETCKKEFGDPVSCPDGISGKGVSIMTNHEGQFCMSWQSKSAAKGYEVCHQQGYSTAICSKVEIKYMDHGTANAGTLVFKRAVCRGGARAIDDPTECKVYKTGICLDIPCGAALPFFNTSHGPSTELLDEVPTDHAWVKHAKEAMRAGNFPGVSSTLSACDTCCVFGSVAGGGQHFWYSTGYLWEKQVFGIAATWILNAYPDNNIPDMYKCSASDLVKSGKTIMMF